MMFLEDSDDHANKVRSPPPLNQMQCLKTPQKKPLSKTCCRGRCNRPTMSDISCALPLFNAAELRNIRAKMK